MKRISLILCLILVMRFIPAEVFAAEVFAAEVSGTELENIAELKFSSKTDVTRLASTNLTLQTEKTDNTHGTSLKVVPSGDTASYVGYFKKGGFESGRYNISFEVKFGGTSGKRMFEILSGNAASVSAAGYAPVLWNSQGERGVVYAQAEEPDIDTLKDYDTNRWYSVSVWLDTNYKEIDVYVDGERVLNNPLPSGYNTFSGFAFKLNAGTDALWLDNIALTKESGMSAGLSPFYTSYTVAESVVGNNFTKDEPPKFNITLANRTDRTVNAEVRYYTRIKDGETTWSSPSENVTLETTGKTAKSVEVGRLYYGRMDFVTEITANGVTYTNVIPYTMTNHTSDMPNNHRFGVSAHMSRGWGEPKKIIKLLKQAGIGWVRDEIPKWSEVEATEGEYVWPEKTEEFLNLLSENDIKFLSLWLGSAPHIEDSVPIGDEELKSLENYMTFVVEKAKGRIDAIEVWNEFHGTEMSNAQVAGNAEYYKGMHKAVYNAVKNTDPSIKVIGICENSWAYSHTPSVVENYFKEIGTEKCFDAVSLHPYRATPENTYAEGMKNTTEGWLKKYCGLENVPFWNTEDGFSDSKCGFDRNLQAAYTVRDQAVTQAGDIAEVVINYNTTMYPWLYVTNAEEASYGILEATYSGAAKVPYLGKESYVALGYYNGLMAGNTFVKKIDSESGISEIWFRDRNDRDAVMVYCPDNAERTAVFNVGVDSVICADMFGNEVVKQTDNGVLDLTLSGEPQYIIGEGLSPYFNQGANAYYEELKNECETSETFATSLGDKVTAEKIKNSNGEVVYAFKANDSGEYRLCFLTGKTEIVTADAYNRRVTVKIPDKELAVTVTNEYTFVICDGSQSLTETDSMSYDSLLCVLKCTSDEKDADVSIMVYNEGFSPSDLTPQNAGSAIYYQAQTKTDSNGGFELDFPVHKGDGGIKTAYVRCGDEGGLRVYKISVKDNKAVAVETESEKGKPLGVSVSYIESNAKRANVFAVKYDENDKMQDISFLTQRAENGELVTLSGYLPKGDFAKCKVYFWDDIKTMIPLEDFANVDVKNYEVDK